MQKNNDHNKSNGQKQNLIFYHKDDLYIEHSSQVVQKNYQPRIISLDTPDESSNQSKGNKE